jgi:hypothetical protein
MVLVPIVAAAMLAAAAASAQTGEMLVVEPYAGSEEREGDRVEAAFGEAMRVTGFAEGVVAAEPFAGRVQLRRFVNPDDRSTLEILANYRAALEAQGFAVEWECGSRSECGNQSDGGWVRRNGMNLGIGGDVR